MKMKKLIKKIFLGLSFLTVIIFSGCDQSFIDDITSVDPGPDLDAPTIELSSIDDPLTIPFTDMETDVEITLEVVDDIELSTVVIMVDGSSFASFDEFTDFRRFSENFILESLSIGGHNVSIMATDLTGKSSELGVDFSISNEYVPRENEIFYIPFEGGLIMNLVDNSPGEGFGNPTFVQGAARDAIELDAANSTYITFPENDGLRNLQSFTVSYWTYVDFVDEDENGNHDGVVGFVNLANTTRFWGNINTYMDNSSLTEGADMRIQITNGESDQFVTGLPRQMDIFNQWSHHVVTYNDSDKSIKYYINGVEIADVAAGWDTSFAFQDVGQLVLGCLHFQTNPSSTSATGAQPWASYLTGELDEIRIFNVALSSGDVTALFEEVNPN